LAQSLIFFALTNLEIDIYLRNKKTSVQTCFIPVKIFAVLKRRSLLPYKDDSLSEMSTAARRRLMRDFKRLQEDPPAGVSGAPGENNIMVWNAVIFGPDETPFADGTFKLMVSDSILPKLR